MLIQNSNFDSCRFTNVFCMCRPGQIYCEIFILSSLDFFDRKCVISATKMQINYKFYKGEIVPVETASLYIFRAYSVDNLF